MHTQRWASQHHAVSSAWLPHLNLAWTETDSATCLLHLILGRLKSWPLYGTALYVAEFRRFTFRQIKNSFKQLLPGRLTHTKKHLFLAMSICVFGGMGRAKGLSILIFGGFESRLQDADAETMDNYKTKLRSQSGTHQQVFIQGHLVYTHSESTCCITVKKLRMLLGLYSNMNNNDS